MAKKPTRLRFTEDDLADSHVKKAATRADKAADKAEKAVDKLDSKKKTTKLRLENDAAGSRKAKLRFEKADITEIERPSVAKHMASRGAAVSVTSRAHQAVSEYEDDNVGVQSAQEMTKAVESTAYTVDHAVYSHKLKAHAKADKLVEKSDKANVDALYEKFKKDNPDAGSNPFSRWQQKKAIKKEYAAAKAGKNTASTTASASKGAGKATGKAAQGAKNITEKVTEFCTTHSKLRFKQTVGFHAKGALHGIHHIRTVLSCDFPRLQFRGRTADTGISHIEHITQVRLVSVGHKQGNTRRTTLHISAIFLVIPFFIGLTEGSVGALGIDHHLFGIGEIVVTSHRSQKSCPVVLIGCDPADGFSRQPGIKSLFSVHFIPPILKSQDKGSAFQKSHRPWRTVC